VIALRSLVAVVLGCLLAGGAIASPISYLSATTVPSSFAPTGGDFGLGVLTLSGTRPLVIHHGSEAQEVLSGTQFHLAASLREDNSTGGQAKGSFEGGTLTLTDSFGGILLSAQINSLLMVEFLDGFGIVTGSGSFTVQSGSLAADFGYRHGTIFELMLSIEPASIGDFSQEFSGVSDISLAPVVAEPVTITALGIGLAGLYGRRRRRA